VTGELSALRRRSSAAYQSRCEPEQLNAEVEKLSHIVAKPRMAVAMGKEFFYKQAELGHAAAYEASDQPWLNMMIAALEGRRPSSKNVRDALEQK